MMIVGKYLETPTDFVNIMRVCSKYQHLTAMYKFNPIGDTSLFENIQTQHFYKKMDFVHIIPKMYKYIYWGTFTKNLEAAVKKVNDKRYLVNQYDQAPNIADKLVSKNIDHKHIISLLNGLPFECDKLVYDSTIKGSQQGLLKDGMYIKIYYDDDNNSIAFLKGDSENSYLSYSKSLNRVSYYDSMSNIKLFKQDNSNFTISSNIASVIITFITDNELVFNVTTSEQGKMTMKITNKGFSYKEMVSLMFPSYIVSRANPTLIKFTVKRYAVYSLKPLIDDAYYDSMLKASFGRGFNVLLDSWSVPYGAEYNMGFIRYIYYDAHGNAIMLNILPTQIIITTSIKGVVRNIKPLCDMTSYIKDIQSTNIYHRYNFYDTKLLRYYNLTWYDLIDPLDDFVAIRLVICTNTLTRCSCVHDKRYYLKVRDSKLVNF